jgi:hypothetical protein
MMRAASANFLALFTAGFFLRQQLKLTFSEAVR